ncbi:RHS repeat-associated core domain-containing protein [Methylocaldum sp. GT1TLB]
MLLSVAEGQNLYYMRARYYDATVGRFISEDPIGFVGA